MEIILKKLIRAGLLVVLLFSSSFIDARECKKVNPIVGIWNLEFNNGELPKLQWVAKFDRDGTVIFHFTEALLQRFYLFDQPIFALAAPGTWKEVCRGHYKIEASSVVLVKIGDNPLEFTPAFRGHQFFDLKFKNGCREADFNLEQAVFFAPDDICWENPIGSLNTTLEGSACKVLPAKKSHK